MRRLTICGADVSEFCIRLSDRPAPAERTAAEFLQRVAAACTGVSLPVTDGPAAHAVCLGTRPQSGRVKWDGFRLASDDACVYLDGAVPRGTLYAAYAFAERYLGWRCFAPDTEVLPADGAAEVPAGLDLVEEPGFEARCCDHFNFAKNPLFAVRSRINDCIRADESLGGSLTVFDGCHSFEDLCPPKTYFASHPEYYSLWEGKRIPGSNEQGAVVGQLCLTNPDVLRIVTNNVLKKLRAAPGARLVEVSQNDNARYCQCERCAAVDAEEGSHAGTLIRFVNAVAEAVEKEFPDVLVRTFAYSHTRQAPKLTRARHNVLIRYCTIEACFRHPLSDPDCPLNAGTFRRELTEWQDKADQLSIWDYVTNYMGYITPFPNLAVLRENAAFFARCRAIHIFEEDSPQPASGVWGDLKAYLIGRLLWDPYMSEETYQAHVDEFLQAFYGPGWREVRRYLALEHEVTADRKMNCFEKPDMSAAFTGDLPSIGEFLAGEYLPKPYQPALSDFFLAGLVPRIDEAIALWDSAEAQAQTDLQRMHIDRSRLSLIYFKLFCTPHLHEEMTEDQRAGYEAAAERFFADKEKYGFRYNIWTDRYHRR